MVVNSTARLWSVLRPSWPTKPSACSHPTSAASSTSVWYESRRTSVRVDRRRAAPGSTSSTRRQAPTPLAIAYTRWSPVASTATPLRSSIRKTALSPFSLTATTRVVPMPSSRPS